MTTLLNLAAGLDRPNRGRVFVDTIQPADLGESKACKWRSRSVGFIFQRYYLLAELDASQNIEVPLGARQASEQQRKRRVKTALGLVGIADRAHSSCAAQSESVHDDCHGHARSQGPHRTLHLENGFIYQDAV
jgi:ABC-type lipoprotein export system ATPase subunit